MYEEITDAELLQRTAEDDRHAVALLYEKYISNLYDYVFSLCYSREISEEIVQNVFVTTWVKRKEFPKVICFKAYIYRAAKNGLLNHFKSLNAAVRAQRVIKNRSSELTSTVEESMVYNEYFEKAQRAIAMLPDKRKQIFELRINEELSLDEIAGKLHISKSVVKKQLYAGMNFVREYIFKHGEVTILFLFPLFL